MKQQVILQNRDMLKNLRINLAGAKKDLSAFIMLWKYIQAKKRTEKIQYVKVN